MQEDQPLIPSHKSLPEITVKAIFISIFITILLTASNAYLALKVGTTVAASIPASILAMGVLRFFKNSNVLETNIIQTSASAGEAVVAAIAYTIPALVIMHYWQHFYYWQIVCIVLLGGVLGVMFSVPLRRVLLADKTLNFPEGTAIGKVLRASASADTSVKLLVSGGIVGSLIEFMQTGLHVLSDHYTVWWGKATTTVYGFGCGFSPALLAAGFIVGLRVAIALLTGVIVCWLVGIPLLTHIVAVPSHLTSNDAAEWIWLHHLRYIGVGTMIVGGLWLLLTMFKSIVVGIHQSTKALQQSKMHGLAGTQRVERDIPIDKVFWISIILMVPIAIYIFTLFNTQILALSLGLQIVITVVLLLFVMIAGFFISSVCGYFAGLIGSTNSPLSGMVLIVLIAGAFLLMLLTINTNMDNKQLLHLAAATVLIAAIVSVAGALSLDTMQDLKAGQMVGATPWKQQVMLLIGTTIAAFVTPLILDLLFNAYGIGDVFPRAGMPAAQALAAPQGQLIQSVVMGVFGQSLNWTMIYVGMALAVICVIIDEIIKKRGFRLPVLAVGLGIYLPIEITIPMILGGILAGYVEYRYKVWRQVGNGKQADDLHQNGILLACGIVAGSTLMGVVLAIPFVIYKSSNALAIMPSHLMPVATLLGFASMVYLLVWLYRTALRK